MKQEFKFGDLVRHPDFKTRCVFIRQWYDSETGDKTWAEVFNEDECETQTRLVTHEQLGSIDSSSESGVFEWIAEWADARNLIEGSDSFRQLVKLQEEVGELAAGIAKQRVGEVSDAIGDCVVVLTILALQNGLFIEDCIHRAYQVIKDRKGRMVDGVFVKEGD